MLLAACSDAIGITYDISPFVEPRSVRELMPPELEP